MNLDKQFTWKALDGQHRHRRPANDSVLDTKFEATERIPFRCAVLLHFLEELRRGRHGDGNIDPDIVGASKVVLKSQILLLYRVTRIKEVDAIAKCD